MGVEVSPAPGVRVDDAGAGGTELNFAHLRGQADHFDHVGSPEFEVHRPHRESRLYQFLMQFKFARALGLLRGDVRGRTAVVVCAGSGMDAEFLERSGARVFCLDISQGALLRARERANAYGLSYGLVRGDAEHLPLLSQSVDISYVHDGLHHLEQPEGAVDEMCRVARWAVVVTEPASAALTRLAISAGLASEREDSGNLVVRFEAERMRERLDRNGFTGFRAARYLVRYGHPPAKWWRYFDWTPLQMVGRAGFLALGVGLFGGIGNKLSVAAHRVGLAP